MTNIMQQGNESILYTGEKHFSTSEKYNLFESSNIVEFLSDKGFKLDGVSKASVRKKEKNGFQKHLMVFTHENLRIDDENQLQLLATNSYDGLSSLKFNMGVFRSVCANGLVVGDSLSEHRIRHIGNGFYENVHFTLNKIIHDAPMFADQVGQMRKKELSDSQIIRFAEEGALKRLESIEGLNQVTLRTVLQPKKYRREDQQNDLWTIFNKIQESCIRGGIKYKSEVKDEFGRITLKKRTTSETKGIDTKMKINKDLWNIANKILIEA
jgi:hypothetical protein